jgi:hypothetical protein
VFTGQTIELKQDGTAQSIEIRAVPHVVIEMQCKTSAGKAWNGRQVGVRVVGTSARGWFTVSAAPDANRKIVVKVPERAHCLPMDLFTNEFTSLRWRRSGGRLDNSLRVELGAIDADERGYEIICYEAPVALVKPVAEDGTPVTGSTVKADYSEGYGPNLNKYVVRGDVRFDKQDDGRWRSISLLPDEQFMVFVNADGFKPKSEKVMLPEGAVKEIEVKLQRE